VPRTEMARRLQRMLMSWNSLDQIKLQAFWWY